MDDDGLECGLESNLLTGGFLNLNLEQIIYLHLASSS